MRWQLEHPKAYDLIAAYEFHGVDIPRGLIPPELYDVERTLWHAYHELSTERPGGMGRMPIPWSAIGRYYALNPGVGLDEFRAIIRAMDGVYLSHKEESG